MMTSSVSSSSTSSHAPADTRPVFPSTLTIPAPLKSLIIPSTYVSAASAVAPAAKHMPSCPPSLSLIPRRHCLTRLKLSAVWKRGSMISLPSCSAVLPSTRITLKQLSAITGGTGGSACFPHLFPWIPLMTSFQAVSNTTNISLCRLKKQ